MKIVFADVPMLDYGVALDGRTPNIGLLSLMATAREAAPETIIRYLDVFHTLESHVDEVRRFGPDLYCLSFTSVFAGRGYETILRIKDAFPGIPVILGGPHVSALPQTVLSETLADVCCVGEGDRTIVDLMNAHAAGMPWGGVSGIVARQGEETITTPSRPPIGCLDDLPMPAWDLVDFGRFHGLVKIRRSPSTTIIPSRGCPFNCTFCSNPVWNSAKPRLRHRSKESITEELRYLYNRGIREVLIEADEMNSNMGWCLEVFESIARMGVSDLSIQCNLRATPITDELVSTMKRAGCWLVHLGIESGVQRVLDGIRKNIQVEDIVHACETLKRQDMKIFGFCMLYQAWESEGRLQFETPGEVDGTLRFLRHLKGRRLLDYISWAFATPYPGSELYRVANHYGLVPPGKKRGEISARQDISMALPGVSRGQMLRSRAKGLFLQGQFVLASEGFFEPANMKQNLRHSANKLWYMVRPW